MHHLRRHLRKLLPLALVAGALTLGACEEEGPAEKAGKELDNAAESAGDRIEDATDK